MPVIPEPVRLLAEFPLTYGPEAPPEAPVEKIMLPEYSLLVMPGPGGQLVEPIDLGRDVEGSVEDVRSRLRERARSRSVWFVGPSTRPSDLRERLLRLGFVPADQPPWEERFAAMVRVEPPPSGPDEVVVREPVSFEEYDDAHRLEAEIIGLSEEDRRASQEHRRTFWELQESDRAVIRTFVALVGGEIVGIGRALLADAGVNLSGGSVQPAMRGRGVYRALVRARWDAAVARGTPALTVQAGRMSRPILERLGFEVVTEQHCLIDVFGEPK